MSIRKLIGVLAGALIASVFLMLLISIFMVWMLWLASQLGLQHTLGMDTQTSHNYAFASSSATLMFAVLGFSGAFVAAWRHVNCEHAGCPWPGHRHPDHGRPVCRRHYHSDVTPKKK